MKKINSKQTGKGLMSPLQTIVSMAMVSVWVVLTAGAYFAGLNIYLVLVLMFVVAVAIIGTFFTIIFDKTVFNRHVTYITYRLRVRRGDAKIHTFVLPPDKLKKHIPIEQVHEGGLIEYSKKQYGILCRYDPPPVAKSETDGFHAQMEKIANSFPPGIEASFHFYNMIDRTNPLAATILRSINEEGKTVPQKEHLHSIYEYATESNEPTVATEYLLAIRLGTYKTPDLAMLAYRSVVPGLMKSLRERGVYAVQLIGENEIAIELRKFATMERYQ